MSVGRRGFFAALAGLVTAPVVAKLAPTAAEALFGNAAGFGKSGPEWQGVAGEWDHAYDALRYQGMSVHYDPDCSPTTIRVIQREQWNYLAERADTPGMRHVGLPMTEESAWPKRLRTE